MKKFATLFLMMLLTFSAVSAVPAFAANTECKENALDGAWDWYTTLGKQGMEKDQILAQNKADRLKRCVEKAAKEAGDAAGKTAADAKKKLGF